ncbi:MAG TPA: DNA methyltransferase [Candidatus Thermoplasmatota archaeon]|nr:DNA methyltransferase [Candidatus Thermoplasmatota archaeon]
MSRTELLPYQEYVQSTRTGGFFGLHPYPTKINPAAITQFLRAHSKPGDTVFDCFAGSCSLAAAVAELNLAEREKPPRKAVCNDLGLLPTWVARAVFSGASGQEFRAQAFTVLALLEKEARWLYGDAPQRHAIWTDFVKCPTCQCELAFFDKFVDQAHGAFRKTARCDSCKKMVPSDASRVMETVTDPVLGKVTEVKRRPVRVYDESCKGIPWGRPASTKDLRRIQKARNFLAENSSLVPVVTMDGKWTEMHRAGYHAGISHLHHFYTPTNLAAVALLMDRARRLPAPYGDLLSVAISSYNAAHSTLMTRFVFKKGNSRPVVTSAQPGALYVSHCPVEKNVFLGVKRKVLALATYLDKIQSQSRNVTVIHGPAQRTPLASGSVDYIFTDPPFGGNIQYSEIAAISEGWLGAFTDATAEAVVSSAQGKRVAHYEDLLASCFAECFRVLKPGAPMTVVFHSTEKAVWQALTGALQKAGFQMSTSTLLDKTQKSFKQVTAPGSVSKDPVLLVHKPGGRGWKSPLVESKPVARGNEFAFSEYVAKRLAAGLPVDQDAAEFHDAD